MQSPAWNFLISPSFKTFICPSLNGFTVMYHNNKIHKPYNVIYHTKNHKKILILSLIIKILNANNSVACKNHKKCVFVADLLSIIMIP